MSALLAILVLVAGAWALAFAGASLKVWTAAVAVYIGGLLATGVLGAVGTLVAAVIFIPFAVLLNVTALRSVLITKPIFATFRKVLPPMTSTEREALEAGDTWIEGDLFQGAPDWNKLLNTKVTELSNEERAFIDNQVETLCRMIDEDKIVREEHDLSPETWEYIKKEGFFSLIIPKQYGGRQFSSLAQSTVVTKIATRSISAAVTVMVPNSLGPGELLMHYGTQEQKDYWLPGLAKGEHIPCFALTGPEAGSDAGAMPDTGVVCKGEYEGKEVLGIRLNFSKRYITLAPVATCVGLAFKLYDPEGLLGDQKDVGITCALVPAEHPGIDIGKRHYPMGLAFMNGPIQGKDVFIPLDWVIGGKEMVGKGWRMLVECLSVGRAISLPALGTAAGKMTYRMTGAYSAIRRQFKLPIGKFEGVQEAMARIGGYAYRLEASRVLTASAGDNGIKPSVVSAIAKYHMTEMMRVALNDAMDIHGGRGIIYGPRNYLGYAYQAIPVGITVEGANILTRNLMIFGQGAIRCHPFVFPEMEAARNPNEQEGLEDFDKLLFGHIGYSVNRGARAFTFGLTGALFAKAPVSGPTAGYYRQLTRMSSALAFVSDVAMGVLGGELKRKERLSARLADVLSHLYLATAVLKFHYDAGQPENELAYVQWSVENSLYEISKAFDEFFANFPNRVIGRLMRTVVFPLGRPYRQPADKLGAKVANQMMELGGVRDRVTQYGFWAEQDENDITGRMEVALRLLPEAEPVFNKFQKAVTKLDVPSFDFEERLQAAVAAGALSDGEADLVRRYEKLRYEAIITDAFDKEVLAPKSQREPELASEVA
ncbi:acyl-CoA dehydrogenase [Alkalilimnicola ehrlichii]|uniref:Acyl-coenzyme A dehydrogenase n=1 Tax=Alkalilimnicola ehrlichii TaxID=351052 RepID=A0A3E0WWU8_9GAMM|nr:acyl-CoA dehydrogenase [Alkalilimnicola ehrlichii]RFA29897.1 acyl-CoA dehydrogenase [Alkalilimnicola ehrlichii]RFA36486.1 acyl-CoA dehydrogenase [Alkalilimnicola ehrlichii]